MWNIVICDQDELYAQHLAKALSEFYETRSFETNIRIFLDGNTMVDSPNEDLDLILLNTRPGGGRMDYVLAKQIQANHPKAQIIFMSDYDDDIFEAIKYHPFCYIRKMHWRRELIAALENLWETIHKGHFLQIKLKRRIVAIMIDDIMYLESSGHYVVFHCTRETYRTREKLPYFIEKLKGMYFVQPSKSFLVNCDYVDKCTDKFILKNGEEIVCTKTRYRATIDFYKKYVREMHVENNFSK